MGEENVLHVFVNHRTIVNKAAERADSVLEGMSLNTCTEKRGDKCHWTSCWLGDQGWEYPGVSTLRNEGEEQAR